MRHNEGYHRSRGSWRLNERQRQILDALSAGATNRQIAAQLGITVDGAKWHVGQLLAETGCEDRQALARWWQANARGGRGGLAAFFLPWRAFWPLGGLAAVVAVALLLTGIPGGQDDKPPDDDQPVFADVGEEAPAVAATARAGRSVCPETDGDAGSVEAESLAAEGLIHVGEAFSNSACSILVVNRADRGFVRLPLDATIFGQTRRADFSGRLPVFSSRLPVSLGDAEVTVLVSSYTAYTGPGQELAVTAVDDEGRVYRPAVDSEGGLWLDGAPLPQETVGDYWTGEALDVGDARRLGRLDPAGQFSFTSCAGPEDASCSVSYRPLEGFFAPAAGTVQCFRRDEASGADLSGEPIGGIELDAGDFVLRFERLHTGASHLSLDEDCQPRAVRGGDPLGNHYHYRIKATSRDGSSLSVGVALDGTLVVGDFRPTAGCPCTRGN